MSGKRLQKVFFNADIFTNNQENFRPDSIVVEGNSISWIGNFQDLNISNYNNSIIIFFNNGLILEVNSKNGNIISESNLKINSSSW